MWKEPLTDEGVDAFLRHRFVVLTGIADIGKDLCERFLVVDAHKVAVLFEFFFIFIIGVDIHAQIVVVGLLMHVTLQRQTVGEGRLFVGPTHGERGHGHRELRRLYDIASVYRAGHR